jgi:tetratricopeptide (TPR) repeat protein
MSQPQFDLRAPELVLRAWAGWEKDQSLAGTKEALKLLDEALRLDPNLVPALTSRTALINFEGDVDPNQDRERIGREQDDLTTRAVSLDSIDPAAWTMRSIALEYLGRWDSALAAGATAIKLDPYWTTVYWNQAWIMNTMGRPAEALSLIDRAHALNPASGGYPECQAHLFAGHAEEAIATCEKAVSLDSYWFSKLLLVAAYANHGDMAKAAAAKADVLRTVPGYTIAQLRAKRYSDHPEYQRLAEKYWYDGLRKAGIPEQ